METRSDAIIIIGTGRDLGYELARKFGQEVSCIILMGRNMDAMRGIAEKLIQENIAAYPIYMDLTDRLSIEGAFSEADKQGLYIRGMIYNAVARRACTPTELTAEDAAKDMEVNFFGAISCTTQILSRYKKQGDEFIIYTGGGVASAPSIQAASMSAGKAALRNYAINLAEELKNSDIFIGTATITRKIQYGTAYSPDRIAETYLRMTNERTVAEIVI